MKNKIRPYPSLNEELLKRIRLQKSSIEFFYRDKNGFDQQLGYDCELSGSSTYYIKDESGVWSQETCNFGFRRKYCLKTFQCLFGENGVACKNAEIGLAIEWTSADSKQRGVIKAGKFSASDTIMESTAEKLFTRAQLRGELKMNVILYIEKAGSPDANEIHLANQKGFILGELESYSVLLDGKGSIFPIYEVNEPGQPLWYVKCDWIDPTSDSFEENVSLNINTGHKNYKYIDQKQKTYDPQLLNEIMASALSIIIEKVRLGNGAWEQIFSNKDFESGSIGEVIYYFADTLEWDLSTPEKVSLCARKFFDKRM